MPARDEFDLATSLKETEGNVYQESRSIGGTDAGAIIGLNRYKSIQDVWDRLSGRSRDRVDDNKPVLERGRVMEPIIARLYERETGRRLEVADRLFHNDHPFLHASFDRRIVSGTPVDLNGPGVLEIKCLGSFTFKQTKEEGIDPSYYAQIQHYLFVGGFKWGSFAVFNADLWELFVIDVARDEPFIAQMVDACVRFWTENVETGTRPEGPAVRTPFMPANVGGEAVSDESPAMLRAMHALKEARENFTIAEHQKKMAEDAVRELAGDRELILVPGMGKLSNKYESRTSFDEDAFRLANPDIDLEPFKVKKQTERRVLRASFGR